MRRYLIGSWEQAGMLDYVPHGGGVLRTGFIEKINNESQFANKHKKNRKK